MNESEMMRVDEISLYDLVQPLLENWKLIMVTSLLGVLVGAAGWWMKGYDAELKANPVATLDFVEWRRIVSGLPMLAESRLALGQVAGNDEELYRTLRASEWWAKNVTPQYRYSKGDVKELGAVAKDDLDKGATQIEAVVFRAKGRDHDDAVAIAAGTEGFIREGGLLLALKSIVERMDLEVRQLSAETNAKLSRDEIELGYLEKRLVQLRKMSEQYPDRQGAVLQSVLDPKSDSARFLPIVTQQVAVSKEINDLQEAISRSRDRLAEAIVVRAFNERALPLLRSEPEGFAMATKLELIETELRKDIDPANRAQVAAINAIARDVRVIHERFRSLFESNTIVIAKRPKRSLPLALGLVGGWLAGILFVFVRTAWRRARCDHEARAAA